MDDPTAAPSPGQSREELIEAVILLNGMVDGLTEDNRELRSRLDEMTIRALQAERKLLEDEAYIEGIEVDGRDVQDPAVYGWRRAADPLDQIVDDMAAGRGAWADKPVRGWRRRKTA